MAWAPQQIVCIIEISEFKRLTIIDLEAEWGPPTSTEKI